MNNLNKNRIFCIIILLIVVLSICGCVSNEDNDNYKKITISRVYINQLNRTIYVVTEKDQGHSSLSLGSESISNGSKSTYSFTNDFILHETVRWYEISAERNEEGKYNPKDALNSKEYEFVINEDMILEVIIQKDGSINVSIKEGKIETPDIPSKPDYIKPENLPSNPEEWEIKNEKWVVWDSEIVENKIILLTGNLKVYGNLTLKNVTLIMNCSENMVGPMESNYYSIEVNNELNLNNSIITVYNALYKYRFIISNINAKVFIDKSEITYARDIYITSGKILFSNCTFRFNYIAIDCNTGSDTTINYCLFEMNEIGIQYGYGNITEIKYNIFRNNSDYAVWGTHTDTKVEFNYWDTTNKTIIKSKIYGDLDFEPWLIEPPF